MVPSAPQVRRGVSTAAVDSATRILNALSMAASTKSVDFFREGALPAVIAVLTSAEASLGRGSDASSVAVALDILCAMVSKCREATDIVIESDVLVLLVRIAARAVDAWEAGVRAVVDGSDGVGAPRHVDVDGVWLPIVGHVAVCIVSVCTPRPAATSVAVADDSTGSSPRLDGGPQPSRHRTLHAGVSGTLEASRSCCTLLVVAAACH